MHATGSGGFVNSYFVLDMLLDAVPRILNKITEQQACGRSSIESYCPMMAEVDMINDLRNNDGSFESGEACGFDIDGKGINDASSNRKTGPLCKLSAQQLGNVVRDLYSRPNFEQWQPEHAVFVVPPFVTPPKLDTTSLESNSMSLTSISNNLLANDNLPRPGRRGLSQKHNSCYAAALMPFLLDFLEPHFHRSLEGGPVFQELKELFELRSSTDPVTKTIL
jgi:hypothetical protein